ncbi:MAG: hypothetical protein PVH61_20665 [Candidatus Aminicenantes bacterium]
MRRNNFVSKGIIVFLLSVFFVYLLISQDSRNTGTDPGDVIEELRDGASINHTKKVVRVKGNGFGPEDVKELGRRKILAKRAAEMDAYRNLVEVVRGVRVTSYASVEDMMLESDTIKTQATAMLKGMQVVAITYSNDGSCEVTVEVNLDRDGSFLLAAFNNGEVRITDNYPKFDWIAQKKELEKLRSNRNSLLAALDEKEEKLKGANQEIALMGKKLEEANSNKSQIEDKTPVEAEIKAEDKPDKPESQKNEFDPTIYTGLLVDAREVGLKPVLAPSIFNENKEKMYGIGVIPTNPSGGKIVKYTHGDIEWAKRNRSKKIGSNPLIVKCSKVVDKSDVMISNEDAQKVAGICEVLEQEKVAILI